MSESNQDKLRCWHFWRKQYTDASLKNPLCASCLKRHPDYWKWKLQWRLDSAVRMDNDIA